MVKFGLVLIYIIKVYCKKSSSILLRKNMFNSILAFFFWKACTLSSFETFLYWKSRNYSQHSSLKIFFLRSIYLEWFVIGVVFFIITNVRSVQFGLVSFFFFYCYSPWKTLTIHKIAGKGEGILIFLVFHFLPAHENSFSSSRFLPLLLNFCLINLFVITDETCSP